MPTYKFYCMACAYSWEESQPLVQGKEHVAACSKCHRVCRNIAFGGTGTLLKGRYMNQNLSGFPDNTARLNKQADEEGAQMEKEYDAYVDEVKREKE